MRVFWNTLVSSLDSPDRTGRVNFRGGLRRKLPYSRCCIKTVFINVVISNPPSCPEPIRNGDNDKNKSKPSNYSTYDCPDGSGAFLGRRLSGGSGWTTGCHGSSW